MTYVIRDGAVYRKVAGVEVSYDALSDLTQRVNVAFKRHASFTASSSALRKKFGYNLGEELFAVVDGATYEVAPEVARLLGGAVFETNLSSSDADGRTKRYVYVDIPVPVYHRLYSPRKPDDIYTLVYDKQRSEWTIYGVVEWNDLQRQARGRFAPY